MKKRLSRLLAWALVCVLCLSAFPGFADSEESTAAEESEWMQYPADTIYTVSGDGSVRSTDGWILGEDLTSVERGAELVQDSDLSSFIAGLQGREEIDRGMDSLTGYQEEYATAVNENMPYQLTIDDIQAMNPGSTVIDIYSNQGYLSLLIGKFYEGKVENMEDGIKSILGMAAMLGIGKGSEFFSVYKSHNNMGYTFYTYQQRYGGMTLRNATLRIAVDPDGYTAGLSCSFVPNAGMESQDPLINADEALELVRERNASQNLTYYPERTARMALPFLNRIFNCWVVYTSNPYATQSFDMPYLEHFVTTYGEYVCNMPANAFATGRDVALDHSGYFDVMKVQTYSTTLTLEDGSQRAIEVPVSYNPNDSKYYLVDPSRKIAVAQYYDFNYSDYALNFVTSDTIDGWSQNNLLAYANYIILYDFYADHGLRSVDGFETPILITVDWCDENHKSVDNACFYGVNNGWACFGVSNINHMSDCVDVVGHEYTHGVTRQSMQGSLYSNETGAINEAYSDIMGNLAEMSLNYTEDRTWLVGERSGKPTRNMGNPNEYKQPAYVGDRYYKASVLYPESDLNDNGGVHDNNSLLGHIAYMMDQTGMSYEEQITMWYMSIEMLTPYSTYSDVHGALLFSLKMNGMLEQYGPALNKAFEAAGLNVNWNKTYRTVEKAGCGRVNVPLGEDIASLPFVVAFYDLDFKFMDAAYVDSTGVASALLKAGDYIAAVFTVDNDGNFISWRYSSSGWKMDEKYLPFTVEDGKTIELTDTPQETAAKKYKDVSLALKDGGYYSLLVPEGWEASVTGEYTGFGFRLWDPDNPSTQVFFYVDLAPYYKTEASRQFWTNMNVVYSIGPVLPSQDVLGVLATWSSAVEGQKLVGPQLYPDLRNIQFVGGTFFNSGIYAEYNPIESGCVARCDTDWDTGCKLTIQCSLLDFDVANLYGDLMYFDCMSLYGIMAPEDRYDQVFDILQQCLPSLRFSAEYIALSKLAGKPLADQATITANLTTIANVQKALYECYGK